MYREAKSAGVSDKQLAKMLMDVMQDEIHGRDEANRKLRATLERYRIFWCEHWTCSKCGEKTAQEPLWEPET